MLVALSSLHEELFLLMFIIIFCELFITDTIFFVAEIEAKKTVIAVSAVIAKRSITAVFEIESVETMVAFLRVDNVDAPFAFKRKDTVETIFAVEHTIGISAVLTADTAMREIAISAIPPVIGVFTVFVVDPRIVRNRTLLKEFFRLHKKRLVEIDLRGRRQCRLIPFIFVPDGIGTIRSKNRHYIAPSFITFSGMERPMWPKCSQMPDAQMREHGRFCYIKFRADSRRKFRRWNRSFMSHAESIMIAIPFPNILPSPEVQK